MLQKEMQKAEKKKEKQHMQEKLIDAQDCILYLCATRLTVQYELVPLTQLRQHHYPLQGQ